MKDTASGDSRRSYLVPFTRVVEMKLDLSFLASNLEPIDGGGEPDIDW